MIRWLIGLFNKPDEPNSGYPEHEFSDRIPLDADCPDTMPTSPGALDDIR